MRNGNMSRLGGETYLGERKNNPIIFNIIGLYGKR